MSLISGVCYYWTSNKMPSSLILCCVNLSWKLVPYWYYISKQKQIVTFKYKKSPIRKINLNFKTSRVRLTLHRKFFEGGRVDSPVVGLKTSWVVYHSVRYSHCGWCSSCTSLGLLNVFPSLNEYFVFTPCALSFFLIRTGEPFNGTEQMVLSPRHTNDIPLWEIFTKPRVLLRTWSAFRLSVVNPKPKLSRRLIRKENTL